jgi:hypothetical protein
MMFDMMSFGFGAFGDASAMPQEAIAEANFRHVREFMNATPPDYRLLANYRPPVHVPQGWADWVAVGDELH